MAGITLVGTSALALVFVILAITGIISDRLNISPILFFILFGMALGPNAFNVVKESRELSFLKQLGLIILLFLAGLDFNVENFRDKIKNAIIIAIPPAIVGFCLSIILYLLTSWFNIVETMVLGLILTTTSISLSLSVLREKLGRNTHVYDTMVLAIILSNVIMILLTGLITRSIVSGQFSYFTIFSEFFVVVLFVIIITYLSKNVHLYWIDRIAMAQEDVDLVEEAKIKNQRMQFALGILGLILLIAFILKIDLAIASFFAGLYVSQTTRMDKTEMIKMNAIGYGLLIPIFFFTMGMQINLGYFIQISVLTKILIIVFLSFIGQVSLTSLSSIFADFSVKNSIFLGIGLSACSLSGGFAILSIADNSNKINDTVYSIFAAIITLSVLLTVIGLEIFETVNNRVEFDLES